MKLRKGLPLGYKVVVGGALERSDEATKFIAATVPMMLVTIVILLMFQLQNIAKMF